MKALTGAAAILQVAHTGPDGRLHGHTYEITGWWDGEPCAVEMQGQLARWVEKFDHGRLPLIMNRAEDIGRQCIMALGCVAVDVNRPLERLFARVELSDKEGSA
jgi:hypothetical protein